MDPSYTRFIQKVCIQVFSWTQDHTTICRISKLSLILWYKQREFLCDCDSLQDEQEFLKVVFKMVMVISRHCALNPTPQTPRSEQLRSYHLHKQPADGSTGCCPNKLSSVLDFHLRIPPTFFVRFRIILDWRLLEFIISTAKVKCILDRQVVLLRPG